jgi:hypothetical protein
MPFLIFCISESVQIVMQRNYRFFFMFVFSATLLCIYVFAFCWVYIRRIMKAEETTIWKAMIKSPASIVLIIYTFICMWFVGGLTAFHLYLISTNQVINHFFLNLHINVLKILNWTSNCRGLWVMVQLPWTAWTRRKCYWTVKITEL